MNVRAMTPIEIRQAGLEALAERLGPVGMVRFLQQYEAGRGDYSVQRHEWLDDVDVKTLAMRIEAARHPASKADNAARRSCCRRRPQSAVIPRRFLRGLYPSLTLP